MSVEFAESVLESEQLTFDVSDETLNGGQIIQDFDPLSIWIIADLERSLDR